MAADYVLVNCAAVAILGAPVTAAILAGAHAKAVSLIALSVDYYTKTFLPLSCLFPLVLLWSGAYRRAQSSFSRNKLVACVRGAITGVMVFSLADRILARKGLTWSPDLVQLCLAVLIAVATARLFKDALLKRFSIERRSGSSPGSVLVVGGAGYIGSILVRKLLARGYKVRIMDSLVYGDSAIRDVLGHSNLELHIADCRNMQSVIASVKGMDSVIHLAAIVGDPACDLDHRTALEINYASTRMLIEVAKGHGIQRLVFASSCSVYGATEHIMEETSETVPLSVYGETKLNSEAALLEARDAHFHPVIARLATVFGNSPRPRFDLVVNLLTAKAHAERVITIYNGEQWRPFIHVDDVARGFVALLEAPLDRVSGEIFNVGDSRLNFRLTDVAARIRKYFPDTQVVSVDNSDKRNYRVSFDKIRTRVGFDCRRSLDDGIVELKNAFSTGAISEYTNVLYSNQRFLQAQGTPVSRTKMDADVMAAFSSLRSTDTAQAAHV